jgi:hypothetical protein
MIGSSSYWSREMGTPMLGCITYGLPLGFAMRDSESLKNGHLLAGRTQPLPWNAGGR